ncbi:hypothetical protein RCH09_003617 [Actimicrobium sp. GrIS 1.19]|uniref:replication initiation protein n=1 Tax=Actimicrobium sp. GrIS 1.19 TaxID=3071708 RepID=UPI002E061FA2|nr:hypothetical protein [Actimicrobium sp. GrIS 1.19]
MALKKKPVERMPVVADADNGELKSFRKANEAIGLRVAEGHLSLLSRKVFNLMMYHAQRQREPGKNAPIATEAAKGYYWIPLAEIARDAAYNSNDTEKLKSLLAELDSIRIHTEDSIQWTSQRLVSAVTLVNPAGLKKKGGQLWFGFAFPPEVAALVTSPASSYTKLAIYYQTMLRSGSSLGLYEVCRRYLDNPSKVTNRQEWQWWYDVMSGNPISDTVPQYKYFKRDLLKPAIAEINATTDITIELIEHTQGRKIVGLQFRVTPNEQSSLQFPAPTVIDMALLARIMALGLTQKYAEEVLDNTEEATILATLALVEERMASTTKPRIDSPAAFFKTALKDGYASSAKVAVQTITQQVKAAPAPDESPDALRLRYLAARAKDGYALFNEMPDDEQGQWIDSFKKHRKPSRANSAATMASALFRNEFSFWFAEQQWQEPSHDDILAFAIGNPRSADSDTV